MAGGMLAVVLTIGINIHADHYDRSSGTTESGFTAKFIDAQTPKEYRIASRSDEALAGVRYYSIAYDNESEQQYVPFGFENIGVISVQDSEDVIESTENGIAGDLGVLGMAACAARRWKS